MTNINYKGYTITGSEEIRYVAVDAHGNFSPKSYATLEETMKAIDEDIENSVVITTEVETMDDEKVSEVVNYPYQRTPYGKYLYRDDLWRRICDVFGIEYFICARTLIIHSTEEQAVRKIEKVLIENNMIKLSKSGCMFCII